MRPSSGSNFEVLKYVAPVSMLFIDNTGYSDLDPQVILEFILAQVEKAEQEKQTAIVRAQGEVSTSNGHSAAWRNLALMHPAHIAQGYLVGA